MYKSTLDLYLVIRLLFLERLFMRKERVYEFDVVILEDESGGYIALVPALPGCHTQGDTVAEVLENIREAIELYLETLSDDEKEELLHQKVIGIQRVKAIA